MADFNTLNTRIKLKYDSYENWLSNDPVLLAGEVAIATIDSNDTNKNATGFQNLPNVVIKVGNGTAKYSELKFVSGLAADVYDWAKAATKPVYTANEIDGLAAYIAGEIQDTDTRYTLVAEENAPYVLKLMATDPDKSDLTYDTLVATIDLSGLDTRLKAVEEALGEGGSVSEQIADAVEAIALAEQTAGVGKVFNTIKQENGVVSVTTRDLGIGDIAGLQDAIDAKQNNLPIDGTPSEENKVATQSTVTGAINALNNTDAAVSKQFVTAVKEENGIVSVERKALEAADIPMIGQDQVDGLEDALAGKQDNLVIADGYNGETNPVATVATVTKAVADLEGAMHFRGKVEGETLEAAIAASEIKDWAAGDVVLFGEYEYVFDGANWIELGNTSLYELKADADAKHKELADAIDELGKDKQDNLVFDGSYNAESNKVATVQSVTDRIASNNESLKYAGGEAGANKFVTKVTQEAGVIAAEYAQPAVADIAGLQGELDAIDKAIEDLDAAKQDVLPIDGTPSEENKVATNATVTNAINALNAADAAVEGQFVTSVSEENGIVKVARGNVTTDHIKQGSLVLVFDCGTSAL